MYTDFTHGGIRAREGSGTKFESEEVQGLWSHYLAVISYSIICE